MDHDSQTQIFYAGEFLHALDGKNRITIPSRWRHEKKDDGEEFIILPGKDDEFLRVMLPTQFAGMSAEVKSNPDIPPRDKSIYLRNLHGSAEHASSDKQGRLVLPEDLCRLTSLKGEVTLVGGLGHFEIWNTAKRKQTQKDEKTIARRVADMVGH